MSSVSVPDFVDYPEFYRVLDNVKLFSGVFCYVIEPYDFEGISLYVGFREEHTIFRVADFKSYDLAHDQSNPNTMLVMAWSQMIKEIMRSARIADGLFYFSVTDGKPVLVDMMVSANKFVGPGMLRDLFGNSGIPLQKVVDTVVLDEGEIQNRKGNIVKPSRFRYLTEGNLIRPQYGII